MLFLIHCKISQHILRLQPSNCKGSVSEESSRIKAIERKEVKRRAGSRAAMASIAARSIIVILRRARNIIEQI